MDDREENKATAVIELIKHGSNLVGAPVGAAIGVLTGGPVGVIVGALGGTLLANMLCNIGTEISSRFLSKREEMRIGAVYVYAIRKIEENIENGQQIRQDDFFQEQPGERPAAEEIIEGTLIVAQKEHEEKKLQYYGDLLANIAFHPEIDRAQANFLIRLGESISYRQMCVLAIFARKNEFGLGTGPPNIRAVGQKDTDIILLLQEIDNLVSMGLLNCFSGSAIHSLMTVQPAKANVQGPGAIIYDLMELSKIDIQELSPIIKLLKSE